MKQPIWLIPLQTCFCTVHVLLQGIKVVTDDFVTVSFGETVQATIAILRAMVKTSTERGIKLNPVKVKIQDRTKNVSLLPQAQLK